MKEIPWVLVTIPFMVQAVAILLDEIVFHRKRGLPKWERIGHPIDTLGVLLCFLYPLLFEVSPLAIKGYIALCIVSCLLITKDEFVHKHHCPTSEMWLHAFLFLNHPVLLIAVGLMWPQIQGSAAPAWIGNWLSEPLLLKEFLLSQIALVSLFFLYQALYWNLLWKEPKKA